MYTKSLLQERGERKICRLFNPQTDSIGKRFSREKVESNSKINEKIHTKTHDQQRKEKYKHTHIH